MVMEDNEAVIKIVRKGRSMALRHLQRTHRINLDWTYAVFKEIRGAHLLHVGTKDQAADVLTKGFANAVLWASLMFLMGIMGLRGGSGKGSRVVASEVGGTIVHITAALVRDLNPLTPSPPSTPPLYSCSAMAPHGSTGLQAPAMVPATAENTRDRLNPGLTTVLLGTMRAYGEMIGQDRITEAIDAVEKGMVQQAVKASPKNLAMYNEINSTKFEEIPWPPIAKASGTTSGGLPKDSLPEGSASLAKAGMTEEFTLDSAIRLVSKVCNYEEMYPETARSFGMGIEIVSSIVPHLNGKVWLDFWMPGNGDEIVVFSDSTLKKTGSKNKDFVGPAFQIVPYGGALWHQPPASYVTGGQDLKGFLVDIKAEWGHCCNNSYTRYKDLNMEQGRNYQQKCGIVTALSEGVEFPRFKNGKLRRLR